MIIAIDGPAGSGKTTTAQRVARSLGFMHINTGAMYRGIALKFIREKINIDNAVAIDKILNNTQLDFVGPYLGALCMDGEDVSTEITSSLVTQNVSRISSISEVRIKLVDCQRKMARGKNVVLEGRDIGTVVFPNADHKFFLIADIMVRAERRRKDLEAAGEYMSIEEVILYLKDRDNKDSSRQYSPLMKAEDAIEIDTTNLSIEEQVNCIVEIVNKTNK